MPTLDSLQVGDALPEREHHATNVSLFLYNAAVWNAHRIHYDEQYTTEVEKHPGVIIDGPLQGDWLSQVVVNWSGDDGRLVEFEYSNRRASILGETLTAGTHPGWTKIEVEILENPVNPWATFARRSTRIMIQPPIHGDDERVAAAGVSLSPRISAGPVP